MGNLNWARTRYPGLIEDLAPVLGLALLAVAILGTERAGSLAGTLVLVVLPLAIRRRWPVAVLIAVAVGLELTYVHEGVILVVPFGQAVARIGAPSGAIWVDIGAMVLASFTMADLARDRWVSAMVMVLVGISGVGFVIGQGGDLGQAATLPFVILVPPWLLGDAIRSQRIEAKARREELDRQERDAAAGQLATVAEERRHVARELHDVVAHSVSVMLIQAGAARQVVRVSPEKAEESLLAVEATGREAMSELRHLLRVLSDEGESGGTAPQPGIGQLEPLIERVRHAGLPATLEIAGDRRPLPASVDLAAYRIVQEALTNALRYAQKAATLVRVTYGIEDLRVEVLDSGPAAEASAGEGSGRGLVGMRERANLVGGRLDAGPRIGGGYAVRAWLPVEVPGQ